MHLFSLVKPRLAVLGSPSLKVRYGLVVLEVMPRQMQALMSLCGSAPRMQTLIVLLLQTRIMTAAHLGWLLVFQWHLPAQLQPPRYLSLIRNGTGSTKVTQVSTFFTGILTRGLWYFVVAHFTFLAQPHLKGSALRQYTGYFHSNDDKLNRVWYAGRRGLICSQTTSDCVLGAYTNQLDTIDPTKADALVWLRIINSGDQVTSPLEWYNNHTIANGTSVLTDGAKRDRLVWAGDMSIAVPGIAVSTNDLIPVKNALDSLFLLQTPEGQLPYAGVPFNELGIVSFTYHLYSLIGVSDYYHFSSNTSFLEEYWDQWKLGISWSLSAIDDSGLMNVTEPADWLRFGMGGHNIEVCCVFVVVVMCHRLMNCI
jgi:hypothetical protein